MTLNTARLATTVRARLRRALRTADTLGQLRTELVAILDDAKRLEWIDPVDAEAPTLRDPQAPETEREAESAPAVPVEDGDEWLTLGGPV